MMTDYDPRELRTNWSDVLRAWVVALILGVVILLGAAFAGVAPNV